MKKAALLVSLLLALFIAPSPSHAVEDPTVQTLLQECESDDLHSHARCHALILGIAGVMGFNCRITEEGYSSPEYLKAEVDGLTSGALVQGFKNWARDNPQQWSMTEFSGVVWAMYNTFPCKN